MDDEIIECADIDAWFAMGETGAFGLQYVAQQRAIKRASEEDAHRTRRAYRAILAGKEAVDDLSLDWGCDASED